MARTVFGTGVNTSSLELAPRGHTRPAVWPEPCLGADAPPVAVKQGVHESRTYWLKCLLGQTCCATWGNIAAQVPVAMFPSCRTGGSENKRPTRVGEKNHPKR